MSTKKEMCNKTSVVELDNNSIVISKKIQEIAVEKVIGSLSEETKKLSSQDEEFNDYYDSINSIANIAVNSAMTNLSDLIDAPITNEIETICLKHNINDNNIKKHAFISTKQKVLKELEEKSDNIVYNQKLQNFLFAICDIANCRKYSIEKITAMLINALLCVITNPQFDIDDYVEPQIDFNEVYHTILSTTVDIIESYKKRISSPNDCFEYRYIND